MNYIKNIFEFHIYPIENHKGIIDKIKEFDFIVEDENCRVKYYNPGWSLNGFWIEVITNVKCENYKDGSYTHGECVRDFKNLSLPYMEEYSDRIKDLCNSLKYSFDTTFDTSRATYGNKLWIYYFKIWKGAGYFPAR